MTEYKTLREDDTPKLWCDMTPEEKGALLLAHHEGKVIECSMCRTSDWFVMGEPSWTSSNAYRIRPEPKRETVTKLMHCKDGYPFIADGMSNPTHRITFDLIDGRPDTGSIRMEELF